MSRSGALWNREFSNYSNLVKPYYRDNSEEIPPSTENADSEASDRNEFSPDEDEEDERQYQPQKAQQISQPAKRGRGRPKGSKNRPKVQMDRQHFSGLENLDQEDCFVWAMENGSEINMAFITAKEEADYELAVKLRREGAITTPGEPFEASDIQEIQGLEDNGVYRIEKYDPTVHGDEVFNSRLVREVKDKQTATPYEKSRLVIQAWNDPGKKEILTQSPTIQRASQRLIAMIAPAIISLPSLQCGLWLRDVSQAYTQSFTNLVRRIVAWLPKEIRHLYPEDYCMLILRPLYGIPEAGTHWWATYHNHHKEKLNMITSTYDPCLLVTTSKEAFGLVGMQTDDTLILGTEKFSEIEQKELTFKAKPKQRLTTTNPLMFNGCILSLNDDNSMDLRQKGQGKKIELVDITQSEWKQAYVRQRARGAYIASICQPEASFDLSMAAQNQDPTEDDAKALNKRLQWQLDNLDRGLTCIKIELSTAKLFVFVDGSFANNKDLTSQIGFTIVIANETDGENQTFTIDGNIIHWQSAKAKRVTKAVLASEILGMVAGWDMAYVLWTTLKQITDQLGLPSIPVIMCTDSRSLYDCLVRLGTTKEKRLIVTAASL